MHVIAERERTRDDYSPMQNYFFLFFKRDSISSSREIERYGEVDFRREGICSLRYTLVLVYLGHIMCSVVDCIL